MGPYRILGKLRWTGQLDKTEVVIRHRGAPEDKKVVSGALITDIKKDRFWYTNREETAIPMHRILEIRAEGKILWARK